MPSGLQRSNAQHAETSNFGTHWVQTAGVSPVLTGKKAAETAGQAAPSYVGTTQPYSHRFTRVRPFQRALYVPLRVAATRLITTAEHAGPVRARHVGAATGLQEGPRPRCPTVALSRSLFL
jgi:hypothetical protein